MPRHWPLALVGLFLSTFSLLTLSGPGRIDIIDGQARYEVARSLVEHGDFQIRDPKVWYPVVPGRDGALFTTYRLPHSLLGVPAIWSADVTGPVTEGRRHFFFSLINAIAGASCVVAYAIWFVGSGMSPLSALGWAALGLIATPLWYYSTSTFDDALGTAFVIWALVAARACRAGDSLVWAAISGIAIGTAINCKQPLGVFLLPVLASLQLNRDSSFHRNTQVAMILGGAVIGGLTYLAYERYKFPPGTVWPHLQFAPPVWHTHVLAAALVLLVSPAAGLLWYCPAIIVACSGYTDWRRHEPRWAGAVLVSCVVFFLFICCLGFFKGDIGWGPRYLTPVLGVLWLMAPAGAKRLGQSRTGLVLTASVCVQLLSLGHDPHRLFIRNQYPPIVNIADPWLHFDFRSSHLLYRPNEIIESLTSETIPESYSPAPSPTYALPVPEHMVQEPEAVSNYQLFQSLRPWWFSQRHLATNERPVDLNETFAILLAVAVLGAAMLTIGLRSQEATA